MQKRWRMHLAYIYQGCIPTSLPEWTASPRQKANLSLIRQADASLSAQTPLATATVQGGCWLRFTELVKGWHCLCQRFANALLKLEHEIDSLSALDGIAVTFKYPHVPTLLVTLARRVALVAGTAVQTNHARSLAYYSGAPSSVLFLYPKLLASLPS
jgi:hypothetical protein